MLQLLGIGVVITAIVYGFWLEGGNLLRLINPAELVIICGSAVGIVMVANPAALVKRTFRNLWRSLRGPPFTAETYMATLVMLFSLFDFARRKGMTKLEDELEDPEHGELFGRYAAIFIDAGARDFVCDTLRLTALGQVPARELDNMLEMDVEIVRYESNAPTRAMAILADSLPGLGIVAAVLGVIITMGSMHDGPAEVGARVATALLGTFLGISFSYGLVGPLSANLAEMASAEAQYYEALRAGLSAFARGAPNQIAVECVRRSIPPALRPDFEEMEQACIDARRHRTELDLVGAAAGAGAVGIKAASG